MRARDLDLRELIDFEPKGGIIQFAGDRAVLLNTVALGVLRKELIETVGAVTARGILTLRVCARLADRRNTQDDVQLGDAP